MKSSILLVINEKGYLIPHREFSTKDSFSTFIWTRLISKHIKDQQLSSNETVMIDAKVIISQIRSGQMKLQPYESAAFALTLDRVVVKREHLLQVAAYLEQFAENYKDTEKISLKARIQVLRDLYEQTNIIGVCWQQSEKEDQWLPRGLTEDGDQPYNIYRDYLHWFLFADGMLPPERKSRELSIMQISISYESEQECSANDLALLAEQYRAFTAQFTNDKKEQIKIAVNKQKKGLGARGWRRIKKNEKLMS